MIQKEDWMFKGAIILALGEKGVITKMPETTIKGIDYVYSMFVKLEGEKQAGKYHPDDIKELVVPVV